MTAEDPVEYRIPLADQVQIDTSVGFGYPEAIEAFLRSAPKIIMIGEIINEATASAAMRAAETGHRVLSTLHVKSAAAAITRLRGLKIGVDVISSSLNLIVAQRLLRTLCGACHQNNPSCEMCYGTGWGGRAAVMEALLIDDDVVELLASPVPPTLAAIRKPPVLQVRRPRQGAGGVWADHRREAARVLGPAAGYGLDPPDDGD